MSPFCCKKKYIILLLLLFSLLNVNVNSSKEILIKAFIDTDIESNNLATIQTIIFYMTKDFNLESKQIIGLKNSSNVDILPTNLKDIGYDIKITLEITQIQVTFEDFIDDIPNAIDCQSYMLCIKREIENELHMETSIQLEIIEFDGRTQYYSIDVMSSNPDDLNSGIMIDNSPIIDVPNVKKDDKPKNITSIIVGVILALLLCVLFVCCIIKHRNKNKTQFNGKMITYLEHQLTDQSSINERTANYGERGASIQKNIMVDIGEGNASQISIEGDMMTNNQIPEIK